MTGALLNEALQVLLLDPILRPARDTSWLHATIRFVTKNSVPESKYRLMQNLHASSLLSLLLCYKLKQ